MWYFTPEQLEEAAKPPAAGLANGNIQYISQELANKVALIAQKYTGWFYGHPTRAAQWGTPEAGKVYVDYDEPWVDPPVRPDDCEFCEKTLADERVEARVLGFQAAIDKEVKAGRGKVSFPLTDLPLYLKRRLCVEWNHAFRDHLAEHPYLYYDFEARQIRPVIKVEEVREVLHDPGSIPPVGQ